MPAIESLTAPQKAAVLAGIGVDLVEIASVVTASSATAITFSAIPGTYKDLILVFLGRSSLAANTHTDLWLNFNGDATAIYDYVYQAQSNSVQNGATSVAQTKMRLAEICAANAPAGTPSAAEIIIPQYAGTTWHKAVQTRGTLKKANTTSGYDLAITNGTGYYRSAVAITSIELTSASAGTAFVDGSVATLYGRG